MVGAENGDQGLKTGLEVRKWAVRVQKRMLKVQKGVWEFENGCGWVNDVATLPRHLVASAG